MLGQPSRPYRHKLHSAITALSCAFAGAVLLILMRVITVDEAYAGLRPEVLMLIAGMSFMGRH